MTSTSTSFDQALQTWAAIGLPELQKRLDEQGLELKEHQKELLLLRRELAAKTKEFKRLADEAKLEAIKPLLKLYQNEIDSLTSHKKTVELHFFDTYRVLADAPDPAPLLGALLEAVAASGDRAATAQQLEQANAELARRADYDQLKLRLLHNEQRAAEVLSQRLAAKDAEYKSILEEKEANWADAERRWQSQQREAQKQIEELRTHNEVAELQLSSRGDAPARPEAASLMAELDMVLRDAESLKKRLLELEKRNEELRRKLAASEADSKYTDMEERFKKKVSELEGENALLVALLDTVQKRSATADAAQAAALDQATKRAKAASEEVAKLQSQLAATHDYDEIKQELALVRQLEFGTDDDDTSGVDAQLILRNKQLTAELAQLRADEDGHRARAAELEALLAATAAELDRARELNLKLEDDLSELNDGVGALGSTRFSDTALVMLYAPLVRLAMLGSKEDLLILPIITKQRDRFRDRNTELEDEHRRLQTTIADQRRQLAQLKKDNEQLYERTQYMALFDGTGLRKKLTPKPNHEIDSNPYRASYELKMHPVEHFRMKEQERISLGLNPLERLFVLLTRAILATRATRMLFFFYCMGLHVIVMVVTIYSMQSHASFIPEVGLNESTGGIPNGHAGRPEHVGVVHHEPGIP